jgi:hypothetical protein
VRDFACPLRPKADFQQSSLISRFMSARPGAVQRSRVPTGFLGDVWRFMAGSCEFCRVGDAKRPPQHPRRPGPTRLCHPATFNG